MSDTEQPKDVRELHEFSVECLDHNGDTTASATMEPYNPPNLMLRGSVWVQCEHLEDGARLWTCLNACASIAAPANLRFQRDELEQACRLARGFLEGTSEAKVSHAYVWAILSDALANAEEKP